MLVTEVPVLIRAVILGQFFIVSVVTALTARDPIPTLYPRLKADTAWVGALFFFFFITLKTGVE